MLTLAACSKDEVVQQNPNDAISFSVVTNKAVSRANDGYCNKDLPKSFDVWAKQGSGATAKNYFEKLTYTKPDAGTSWVSEVYRYWPESGSLDFFAALNYNGNVAWSHTTTYADPIPAVDPDLAVPPTSPLKIEGYTVQDNTEDQKDFIYAVKMNADKPAYGTPAKLNFRHALSQIEFMAKNLNTNIHVEVVGVSVKNVKNKGDFYFPETTTATAADEGFVDHNNGTDATWATRGKGVWYNLSGSASYVMQTTDGDSYVAKQVPYHATNVVDLTTQNITTPNAKEYSNETLYAMPQTVDVWDGTGKPSAADAAKKAYFVLTCKIWNVANGTSVDTDNDVVLWGAAGHKEIAVCIPAGTVWEQGKRYVYTFTFTTTGNGGIDEDGNPVLTPIELSVTVDDFSKGTDTDVEMKDPTPTVPAP